MGRYFSLYRMFISKQLKTLMIYRADFFVGILCLFLSFITVTFSIWAIFEKTNSIGGWTKYDVLFMYGYNLFVSGIAWFFFNQAWALRDSVISGSFLKYKIRPINPLFHFFAEAVDLRSVITVILGLMILVNSAADLGYSWALKNILLISIFSILSAALLAGFIILTSAMAFWFTISNPLLGFLASMHGIAHFPMTIYGRAMGAFLSIVVPIAFMSFYPCAILLGKIDGYTHIYQMLAVIVVLWVVATRLWLKGVQHYELSGT
jgi:ABC-2 type transport system permease protein